MADNFQTNVEALFKGMEEFITSKTVVGQPVTAGDTIIVPLMDVSFGMMTSSKAEDRKRNGGGGIGGKMTPSAVLVIKGGTTKLINLKNQDSISKAIDLVPDLINHFMPGKKGDVVTEEESELAKEEAEKTEETF